ncbi:MAG: L-aspartate oxidase [Ignavibacteriaceae bacterium]|nr:L-aspartate oxidase [Ignavibacteriaceae bacterium]
MNTHKFDHIIIGCGLAGLYSAIHASKHGTVALITKTTLELSNSYWAQGGIAAAISKEDSPQFHFDDTLIAGRHLCNKTAVDILVTEGKERVKELIELGMPFDKEKGEIALGLEGGHSRRRVLHAGGDSTGREIVNFILKYVLNNERIKIFENKFVHHLLVKDNECFGVSAYDFAENKEFRFLGNTTIIASGGGAAVYLRSTNPHTSLADGVALAYNVGAEIESMEFMQFHPTSFYSESGETFLISEAVRGEGAYLVNHNGIRFLQEQNLTELAPRDVVSEAIFNEMKNSGEPNVFLKFDHLNAEKIKSRFSNIFSETMRFGIDMTKQPLPVAPAAHFMVGGIKTGLNGETNVNHLYAVGEVASSGVHGANRLASNSLLECLVFAKRAVEDSLNCKTVKSFSNNIEVAKPFKIEEEKQNDFLNAKNLIAQLLWNNVGIVRTKEKLDFAISELENFSYRFTLIENEYYSNRILSLLQFSRLLTSAALIREESRGSHRRKDFPEESLNFQKTIIQQKDKPIKFSNIN